MTTKEENPPPGGDFLNNRTAKIIWNYQEYNEEEDSESGQQFLIKGERDQEKKKLAIRRPVNEQRYCKKEKKEDSDSENGSVEDFRSKYKDVKTEKSLELNKHTRKTNNISVEICKGSILDIINKDTEPPKTSYCNYQKEVNSNWIYSERSIKCKESDFVKKNEIKYIPIPQNKIECKYIVISKRHIHHRGSIKILEKEFKYSEKKNCREKSVQNILSSTENTFINSEKIQNVPILCKNLYSEPSYCIKLTESNNEELARSERNKLSREIHKTYLLTIDEYDRDFMDIEREERYRESVEIG